VRAIVDGDSWTYSISGTSESISSGPVSGTIVETASEDTTKSPGNVDVRAIDTKATLQLGENQGPISLRDWIVQDKNGAIWRYGGRNGMSFWVEAPQSGCYCLMASPLGPTASWGSGLSLSTGFRGSFVLSVIGTDRVTVPAGTFDTYKVAGGAEDDWFLGAGAKTLTGWYAPQISNYVKKEYVGADTGPKIHVVLELKDFSLN
jgi:hypothetical protein